MEAQGELMFKIQLIPHTGKWKVTLHDGTVLGGNYTSPSKAAEKLAKYLKGQSL